MELLANVETLIHLTNTGREFTKWDLVKACKIGDLKMVHYMIQRGLDIHGDNIYQDIPIVFVDIEENQLPWYDLPFVTAVEHGHLEIVRYLLQNGVNIHTHNDCAIVCASHTGHLHIIRYLVEEYNADIHVRDNVSIRIAMFKNYKEIVDYLVGIDPNFYVTYEPYLEWLQT